MEKDLCGANNREVGEEGGGDILSPLLQGN